MKNYSTYLFDADGTILDTTDLIIHCFRTTTEKFGKRRVSDEDIKKYIGLPFTIQCEKYFGKMDQNEITKIRDFHREYQLSVFKKYMKLFDGTMELFQSLKRHQKKIGIVTSRSRTTLDTYLDFFELTPLIDVVITPEDVTNPKPHPESCHLALSILGEKESDTLFIGDAVFDELCASGAKVDFALVGWTHQNRDQFKNVELEIDSFMQFRDRVFVQTTVQ